VLVVVAVVAVVVVVVVVVVAFLDVFVVAVMVVMMMMMMAEEEVVVAVAEEVGDAEEDAVMMWAGPAVGGLVVWKGRGVLPPSPAGGPWSPRRGRLPWCSWWTPVWPSSQPATHTHTM